MGPTTGAELTGQLLVNGELRNEENFKKVSAYVTQVRKLALISFMALRL